MYGCSPHPVYVAISDVFCATLSYLEEPVNLQMCPNTDLKNKTQRKMKTPVPHGSIFSICNTMFSDVRVRASARRYVSLDDVCIFFLVAHISSPFLPLGFRVTTISLESIIGFTVDFVHPLIREPIFQ